VINGRSKKTSTSRRSFRELARTYFAREHRLEFVAEALFCDNRGDLSMANPAAAAHYTSFSAD
jgi:hypothetical protein